MRRKHVYFILINEVSAQHTILHIHTHANTFVFLVVGDWWTRAVDIETRDAFV